MAEVLSSNLSGPICEVLCEAGCLGPRSRSVIWVANLSGPICEVSCKAGCLGPRSRKRNLGCESMRPHTTHLNQKATIYVRINIIITISPGSSVWESAALKRQLSLVQVRVWAPNIIKHQLSIAHQ